MRYVQFALLCEGSSDSGLRDHLADLLVREGADEAVGEVDYSSGTVEEKLRRFVDGGFPVHVLFVHRDADGAGHGARVAEIKAAEAAVANCPTVIPVVPVRMTEAFLLVSESNIRDVAGKPGGSANLGLPPLNRVEDVADPKALLKEALARASEKTGHALSSFNSRFYSNRQALLSRMDIEGPVRTLSGWEYIERKVREHLAAPQS